MEDPNKVVALSKTPTSSNVGQNVASTDIIATKRTSEAPLRSVFTAIVNGNKVDVDLKTLELIITNELHISLRYVDETLLKVLPYMLVHYIRSWPGWTKVGDYKKGLLTLDDWFGKFHQYAIFKLKQLIQKVYGNVLKELDTELGNGENQSNMVSSECQTENTNLNGKDFAPFHLSVEGPPRILNTLIFSSEKDDIYMKMHQYRPWTSEFNLLQLINWPFLEVDFTCQFFSLKRKIVPHYLRYLATTDDSNQFRKPDFIDDVVVESKKRETLSVSFVKKYFERYLEFMKLQKERFTSAQIAEVAIILNEFFRDIMEVGKVTDGTITNFTSISFNIGRCRYVRNKKQATSNLVKDGQPSEGPMIGLCELITPKCVVQLRDITIGNMQAVFQQTSNIPLSFFQEQHNQLTKNNNNVLLNAQLSVMYCCMYCKKQYEGNFAVNAVLKHYQDEHRLEHEIKCNSCKKQFTVADLSKTRWFHCCSSNPELKDLCLESLTMNI